MTKRKQDDPRGHHGTDAIPDRGMGYGTKVQATPMAGDESGRQFARGRNIEDSLASIRTKPNAGRNVEQGGKLGR